MPSAISGMSVLVGGLPAPVLYASKGQLNVAVPFGISPGQSTIQVQGSSASAPLPVMVADTAPGFFYTDDLTQLAYSTALNEDGTLNAWYNPAQWGSIITIYLTGLGPMRPGSPDGTVAGMPVSQPAYPVAVGNGQITYIGNVPGLVEGIVQINVRLPISTGPFWGSVDVSVTSPSGRVTARSAPVYVY